MLREVFVWAKVFNMFTKDSNNDCYCQYCHHYILPSTIYIHPGKLTFTGKKKIALIFGTFNCGVGLVIWSCLEATLNCASLWECFIQKSCKQT